jgi:tetratricopeptide (TPR) repeat protein
MKKLVLSLLAILSLNVCHAQSYYDQGIDAYNADNYDKALEYFNQDLLNNSQNAKSYYFKASIYKMQEKYALGLTNINLSLKYLKPKEKELNGIAYNLRADIYYSIEEYENAISDYSTAIKYQPEKSDYYISRAEAYYKTDKYNLAKLDYQKILEKNPGNVEALAGLGRNYLEQGQFDNSEKTLNLLLKMDPENELGFYFRGMLRYQQKKYNQALDDILNCYTLNLTDESTRDLYVKYAKLSPDYAISLITKKINEAPESYSWIELRAELYQNQNLFKNAINDIEKAINLAESNNINFSKFKRGMYLYQAGIYDLALKDLNNSIETDSTIATYFQMRGETKMMLGNYKSALSDYDKAIELEPTEPWYYNSRAWLKSRVLQDFDGAIHDYEKAIEQDSTYTSSIIQLGKLLEDYKKDKAKAKYYYEQVISIDTAVSIDNIQRVFALTRLGRQEEAIAFSNKILALEKTNSQYYNRACMFSLMGKKTEALENLRMAFELGFNDFEHIKIDDDLNNIRLLPEFKKMAEDWKKNFDIHVRPTYTKAEPTQFGIEKSVTVPMKPQGGGVYEVSCKINDLPLKFIFDTGAADISISQIEAQFMLKNGFLSKNDIIGQQRYSDADGDISVGTKIFLRRVEFGGLVLKNVTAGIVNNNRAPLLFGQSALGKYGKIIINNENNTLTIVSKDLELAK